MSPQEAHRWMYAKLPKKKIGNLTEEELDEMADAIHNDDTGTML